MKVASAAYIKARNLFSMFSGCPDGYGGFTYSYNDQDRLIEYFRNQEDHLPAVSVSWRKRKAGMTACCKQVLFS
jgi:hypothetical protein